MLNVDHACRWIDELAPWLTYVNLYFQGEPLLHPKLDQLIAQCHRHGIYSSTSTNAHHLTEAKCQALIDAGLSRLIVSSMETMRRLSPASMSSWHLASVR